jgi:hypothetical protein
MARKKSPQSLKCIDMLGSLAHYMERLSTAATGGVYARMCASPPSPSGVLP